MKKLYLILTILFFSLSLIVFGYLYILPDIMNCSFVKRTTVNFVKKQYNMDLEYDCFKINTCLKPVIGLNIKKLSVNKDKDKVIDLNDFNLKINFEKIFKKIILLNSLQAKNLDLDLNILLNALPKTTKQNKTDYTFKIFNADISLENLNVTYFYDNKNIVILANNIKTNRLNDYRFLSLKCLCKVSDKNKQLFVIKFNTNNQIKLFNNNIKTDVLQLLINNSKLNLFFTSDNNFKKYNINIKSKEFYLTDIFAIVRSNLIIKNGKEILSVLKDESGKISFDITYQTDKLSGTIILNNTRIKIKDLSDMPLTIKNGYIKITENVINFTDLIGYWGKNSKNKLKIYGSIKDYYKTFDTNITIDTKIDNEFLRCYLSKLINNTILTTTSPIGTRIIYKSKNNVMDIVWLAKIPKNTVFGIIDDSAQQLAKYDRAIKGEFQLEKNILTVKNVNYYISQDIHKGVKIKPLLVLDGKMNLNGKIQNIGFKFTRELPSEILNLFLRQQLFKKGTVKGEIKIIFDKQNIPHLYSNMELKKTFIPSQRMRIDFAQITSDKNDIMLNIKGKFKKAKINLSGKIANKLTLPLSIEKFNFDIDNLDIERFLASVNNQNQNLKEQTDSEITDDDFMFNTDFIKIENGKINIKNGKYKELTFKNVSADLSLDENGILKLQSNKFDLADGISTLKVFCDFKNIKYYIRLGIKDVESNILAKVLLNLDKEISGKAQGLIELNSDKTLKLNGEMKFAINDGTIGKIGLVEYILKIASLFRNPIVMINPMTIADIISIPEGQFKKIQGEIKLKNNVAVKIDIKSYSSTLSALIRGRFDLDKHDASLRLYTRFSQNKKSVFDFLRNISLDALANKVRLITKNDLNYYASELSQLPQIDVDENKAQVFLTIIEGDIEHNNYLSSLQRLK